MTIHPILNTEDKDGIDFIVNEVSSQTEELLNDIKKNRKISERSAVLFFGAMMKMSRVMDYIDLTPEFSLSQEEILDDSRLEVAKTVMANYGRGIFQILEGIGTTTWSQQTAGVISEIIQNSCPKEQFRAINMLDSITLARSAIDSDEAGDSLVAAADMLSMCPSYFQELKEAGPEVVDILMIQPNDSAMIIWDAIDTFTLH